MFGKSCVFFIEIRRALISSTVMAQGQETMPHAAPSATKGELVTLYVSASSHAISRIWVLTMMSRTSSDTNVANQLGNYPKEVAGNTYTRSPPFKCEWKGCGEKKTFVRKSDFKLVTHATIVPRTDDVCQETYGEAHPAVQLLKSRM